MEEKKPKIERLKVKIQKKHKKDKVASVMDILEEITAPENVNEIPEEYEATDSTQEDEKLGIDEHYVPEQKSEIGDSEQESESEDMTVEEHENEIGCLNRHLFGILENTISYPKDAQWSKYTGNAELTLKLNLKSLLKTYYLNQGQLKECEKITLTSNLDFEDPKVVNLLKCLNNPTEVLGKVTSIEKSVMLLNGQILKNTSLINNVAKDTANKPILNAIQLAQLKMVKDIENLKENQTGPNTFVTIKDLQDIVEELAISMEAKCVGRVKPVPAKYPFGYDLSLEKIVKGEGDCSKEEIQLCLKAGISFADPIVATVVLDVMGIDLENPSQGKLMSDFAKNLATPLAGIEPEARIRQKTQFTRVVAAWDTLLNNLVNPGMLSASSLIEESRIALYALQDIAAERLPIGAKVKSLGMLFMAGQQNQPKNDHVLQKIYELRPRLPSKLSTSFEPWPKNKFTWSDRMKTWSKDNIPVGKPVRFVDICTSHDCLSTVACQKDYPYTTVLGKKIKPQRLNANRNDIKPNNTPSGHSGLSVWDICQRNSNRNSK